ncbi:MAG: CmcJ/NvfI family oxidoreductase [Myxococcota bacterium]
MTSVPASLQFIEHDPEKPYFYSAQLTGEGPRFFFDTERHQVSIRDMREVAANLSLDNEGFLLVPHRTSVTDLHDDDALRNVYYPELETLLKENLGAERVVIFDSTRRSDSRIGAKNPDGARKPADRVHVDYTELSAPKRVRDVLGNEEAERLEREGTRIRQVNVWRPMRGPVVRSPLALADASSVERDDLVATQQHFPDRIGEIYHLAYSREHRWYYAPEMTPNEVILIKGWDSVDDGRARFTPHSAFEHPETPENAPPRESIETRTLVIG